MSKTKPEKTTMPCLQQTSSCPTLRSIVIGVAAALCMTTTLASSAQTDPMPYSRRRPPPLPPQAASTLPATQPTVAAAPAPIAATPVTEPVTAAHRAEVTFSNGLLTVRANDSSLHQILRSISRQTGMKITGGIADPRVFGDYGPAPPSTILATLIDGTGVNMLLREGSTDVPVELVLTPRTAGMSPPFDPNAQDAEALPPATPAQSQPSIPPPLRSDRTPQRSPSETAAGAQGLQPPNPGSVPPSMPQPLNNVLGSENNTTPTASQLPTTNSVPLDSLPTPSTAVAGPGIVDSTNPPPPGSTTAPATTDSASPNGVKTPEQIYQLLLQMQQQQQQQKPPQ